MEQLGDEQRDRPFIKWLLAKDERFYVLFLIMSMIFFGVLSMMTLLVISGFVVAAVWLIFYYAILRK